MLSIAVAAAILFISLGIRQGINWDLEQLVVSVGSNLFTVSLANGLGDYEQLSRIESLEAVEDVGGNTAYSQFFSGSAQNLLILAGVTSNYFDLLNLPLAVGEEFAPGSSEYVAILGTNVATALFGESSPSGRTVTYRGRTIRVIGVLEPMPADRGHGATWGYDLEIDNPDNLVFLPFNVFKELVPLPIEGLDEMGRLSYLWVRAAKDQLRAAMKQTEELLGGSGVVQIRPLSARFDGLFYTRRQVSNVLTGISFLILLVASLNVANVLTIAVLSRRREIGIRRALGAQRASISKLFLLNAVVFTLVGGLLGGGLGQALSIVVANYLGVTLRVGVLHIAFAGALVAAGLGAGVAPAILGASLDPVQAISQRSVSARRLMGLPLSKVLSCSAVAIGVAAIVVIAALGARNAKYLELRWLSPAQNVVRIRAGVGGFRQPIDLSFADYEKLAALEGVASAAWMAGVGDAMAQSACGSYITYPAEIDDGIAGIGIGLVEFGRDFTDAEIKAASHVVLIGANVANELFGEEDPLGESISFRGTTATVIGVLAWRPGLPPYDFMDINRALLFPRGLIRIDVSSGKLWIWLRADEETSPADLSDRAIEVISNQYPDRGRLETQLPASEMEELLSVRGSITRSYALLTAFGLCVAAIGAGITTWRNVSMRCKEIGIRMALGAPKTRIFLRFAIEGLEITLIGGSLGTAIGIGIAWAAMKNSEIQVPPNTAVALLAVGVSALIGLIAGALPAFAAARIDPSLVLHKEEQ